MTDGAGGEQPPSAARPAPPIALSTASVFPEPASAAFALAAELGYDGVELMVWSDPLSQDVAAVARLADRYGVPVLAVHAPCLAVTQRVWGADPVQRIRRSVAAADTLAASVIVMHPPFRWQLRYAAVFADEMARAGEATGVALAVENMFPISRGRLVTVPYSPGFDPTVVGYPHYTLDLSHTAAAGSDAVAMLERMGDRLAHVHLTDGSGRPRDEHLVPGRGRQPCAQICERLADTGYGGTVVIEVSTRRCRTHAERTEALHESLLFAQLNLQPTGAGT